MTPATNELDSQYMRLMIDEAVRREIERQIQPLFDQLKQQIQITDGKTKILDRDYFALKLAIDDIKAIVVGDETLGIKGLRASVAAIEERLKKLDNLVLYIKIGLPLLGLTELASNDRVLNFLLGILKLAGI